MAQHRRSRPWRADDQRIEVLGSNGALRAENVVENAVSFAGANGIVRDKPLHFFLERYAEALPRRRTCRISSSGWPSSIGPVLKLKLRKAAEEGAIYFPAEAELVTAEKTRVVEIDHLRFDHTRGGVVATQPAEPADADLLIVSEGDSDRVVIATLAERILASAGSGRSIKILSAMGKVTIPRVANALWDTFHSESKVLIVVDGDNEPAGTAAMLANGLEFGDWVAAIPNPSIETWLGLDLEALRRRGGRSRIDQFRNAALRLDISALKQRDEEFARFHAAILGA